MNKEYSELLFRRYTSYCNHRTDGSIKDTQTNTHTLQIWRFFDSILSIFNTIFLQICNYFVYYALSFLALSLCVVEPLLYFRTMSTITKTSCCDDTTLCTINTTPHKTKETQTRTEQRMREEDGALGKNIRTNGCVQSYEMNAANRLRWRFEFQLLLKQIHWMKHTQLCKQFHFTLIVALFQIDFSKTLEEFSIFTFPILND